MRELIRDVRDRAIRPLDRRIERLEENQLRLARELIGLRSAAARVSGSPIRVLFLCHLGSVWGKIAPLYEALAEDPAFTVDVLTLPYRHPTFGDDAFHDGAAAAFLRSEGIDPIEAYDASQGRWLDLQTLHPDYIFYPTPYDSQYPDSYASAATRLYARSCYVPYYGTEIMRGAVLDITHPHAFYRNLTHAFVCHDEERQLVLRTRGGGPGDFAATLTGAPMLDPIFEPPNMPSAHAWNFPDDRSRTRVLWTPRWRVEEGTCHFTDYSDHLVQLAHDDARIDFVFRPHPLFFDNFITQQRMTEHAKAELFARYERTPNARIDQSDAYRDTFLTGDVLISDVSSMMVEFLATGKPVIYTHRVNNFNDFGNALAQGCYWVRNQDELDSTVQMLIEGEDPMREKRQAIVAQLLRPRGRSASERIKECLRETF